MDEVFVFNARYGAWMPASANPDEWARANLAAPPPRPPPPMDERARSDEERALSVTDEERALSVTDEERAPSITRHISGHTLVEQEAFECPVCCERLVDPVTTECGHTFCRHCLTTCFGQVVRSFTPGEAPRVKCPCCRTPIANHYDVNSDLVAAMRTRGILRALQPGACRGKSATVNRFDGNRTESEAFDLLYLRAAGPSNSLAGTLEADIVWGGGSVHSTYRETTCRVEGTVGADGALVAKAVFSNGPWEAWSGRLVTQQSAGEGGPEPTVFRLVNGEYVWHGWDGRETTGHLDLELEFVAVADAVTE